MRVALSLNITTALSSGFGFDPKRLFSAGEQGVWFQPDPTTTFTDTAGTTPAQVGQAVALMLDKSEGLVLGPELLSQAGGPYVSIPSEFGTSGSIDLSFDNGAVVGTITADTTFARVRIDFSGLTVGRFYRVPLSIESNKGFQVTGLTGLTPTALNFVADTDAEVSYVFQATSTSAQLRVYPFQSSTGATQRLGDFVRIKSLSVRELAGNHATQSSLESRPTLARVPASGRRNILNQSEAYTSYVPSNASVTLANGSGKVFSDNGASGSLLIPGITPPTIVEPCGFSVDMKPNGFNFGGLELRQGANIRQAFFNLQTGEVGNVSSGLATFVEGPDAEGFYRCSVFGPALDTRLRIIPTNEFGITLGDGVSGILFRRLQLELGTSPTPYQKTLSTFDITEAGQPDNFFLSFDGVDDFLSIASFNPAFDKVQVFAGVRKLSDASRASILSGPDLVSFTLSLESPRFSDDYKFTNIMTAAQRANVTAPAPDTSILTAISDFDVPTLANPLTQLRRNGVIAETNTGSLGATAGNYKAGVYTIGCREGTSQFLNGQVYSLVMRFGPNLNLPTIQRTERYVAAKTAGVSIP
jgi:hypothetical protein